MDKAQQKNGVGGGWRRDYDSRESTCPMYGHSHPNKTKQQISKNKPNNQTNQQNKKSPLFRSNHHICRHWAQDPLQAHKHLFQLLTSVDDSHICHVTWILSRAPVSRPVPVIAEVMPALTENMQPVWGHRVPHQRHNFALPTGAEGQTLLEIPVIVSNSPELNCKGKWKEGPQLHTIC